MYDVNACWRFPWLLRELSSLGRLIMAVLVPQLLVWYNVIFWIRLFAYFAVWARSCPYLDRPTCVPYSPHGMQSSIIFFKLKSVSNLYYVQYFMATLSVNYALDLRKLNFLQKLSARHTSGMNLLFSLTARKEFEHWCKNYLVTQAHGRFRTCVWQAFACHLAGIRVVFYCILCTISVYIVLLLSVVFTLYCVNWD